MYAIIDVETTGLSPKTERITEIAILIHDGKKVTEHFNTLVNPEKKIPWRITQITGINNRMVYNAPRFCEIARHILELTQDCILVGHNVSFDYQFIRAEFKNLGYNFERKTLCTAKLSRKLIPFRKSYSLKNICEYLNIQNFQPHRAFGDAQATANLFTFLLSIEPSPENLSLRGCNSLLDKNIINNLPEKAGVYYFYNADNELIYIGKSNNIRQRILQHLGNVSSRKAQQMKDAIASVNYEETGCELAALLLESEEIKKHLPLYNRAQRRSIFQYGLYVSTSDCGYKQLEIARINRNEQPITVYTSAVEAREHLSRLVEEFDLCLKLCGLYHTQYACFHFHIQKCHGACIGKEPPETYNQRVEQLIEYFSFHQKSFLLIDQGRNNNEKMIAAVVKGKYLGFGYFPTDAESYTPERLLDFIKPMNDNRDVQTIIRSYLRSAKSNQLVPL